MSLILTYGQCFVEEWHASCWCLGCFTSDLPRTYNRNWLCRNALMGLMFGTDELWLFFPQISKKKFTTCFFILHLVEADSALTNLVPKPWTREKTYLVVKNCWHDCSFIEIVMNSQPKRCTWSRHFRNVKKSNNSTTASALITFVVFFRSALPPPQPPNQPINSDDCWNLGDWPLLFYILRRFQLWTRILWESNDFMCHVWILWVSQCFLYKDNTCNFLVHFQALHMSSLYIHLWLIYFFHGSWWDEPINKSTVFFISTKLPRKPHWRCSTQVNLGEFFGKTIGYLEIYWKWVGVNDEDGSIYFFFLIFNFSQIHLVDLKLLETGMNMNEYHWAFFLFFLALRITSIFHHPTFLLQVAQVELNFWWNGVRFRKSWRFLVRQPVTTKSSKGLRAKASGEANVSNWPNNTVLGLRHDSDHMCGWHL